MKTRSETQPEFIISWANKIKELRLAAPAVLLLEMHKPFSFIAGQFLLVGQPFLENFLPPHISDDALSLLSNRSYLEKLIQELETRRSGESGESGD